MFYDATTIGLAGDITVESMPGGGSTFTLALPRFAESVDATAI